MKVLWSWLKELLPALEEVSVEEAAEALSKQGIEVAGIHRPTFIIGNKIFVGKIVQVEPLTEKLKVARVELNDSVFTAISGAPNVQEGVNVAVALPGSAFLDKNGQIVVAEQKEIRGETSEAVLLSEREVGVSTDHSGIWILPDDLPSGTNLTELLKSWQTDTILDLEITPNRGDALSHLGIARELRAWLRYHKNIEADIKLPEVKHPGEEPVSVEIHIEDTDGCRRYTAIEIKGISLKPSSMGIQRRLRLLDVNVINNVVDAANYVMVEIGHPLHTFDRKEINNDVIKVRKAFPNEPFRALNDNVYVLSEEDLVIADGLRVLALAGIIGAIDTGVGPDTTDIVLESAWFKPERISKTRRRLGLNTDAAYRFERGTDISITEFATKRFLKVLSDYASASAIKDVYPAPKHPTKIFLSFAYLNKITGGFLDYQEAKRLLELMDIEVKETKEGFHCTVPQYKYDVTRPADLIEEIVRLYGMDNVPVPEAMNIQLIDTFEDEKFFEYRHEVLKRFITSGFQEVQTLSFIEKKWALNYFDSEWIVDVLSSTIGSRSVLRPSLVFSLIEAVGRNRSNNVKLNQYVELGKIYWKDPTKNKFNERWVCALISHQTEPMKHWHKPFEASDYWKLSGHIEQFFASENLWGYWRDRQVPWLQCGRQLIIEDQPVALVGAVPYQIRKEFGIREHVFYAEINIDLLWNEWISKKTPPSVDNIESFKVFWYDISFILPEDVPFGQFYKELLSSCYKDNKPLYTSLIDVYRSKNIGDGKVSYTLRLASPYNDQINRIKNCLSELVINKYKGSIRG
ncbi:MAG: phenylalanine--tRNA ligase subunit beta [Chlorobi bacterium]|nr:phenylalanine--tRNA ligase subunit beta [Chlorobiota bacterium]